MKSIVRGSSFEVGQPRIVSCGRSVAGGQGGESVLRVAVAVYVLAMQFMRD